MGCNRLLVNRRLKAERCVCLVFFCIAGARKAEFQNIVSEEIYVYERVKTYCFGALLSMVE